METLDDLFRRLEQLNDIGASLSNERDLDRLLEKILLAANDEGSGVLRRNRCQSHYTCGWRNALLGF